MNYKDALDSLTAADAMSPVGAVLDYDSTLRNALSAVARTDKSDITVGRDKNIAGFVHAQDIFNMLVRGESLEMPVSTLLDACKISGSNPCIQVNPQESLMNVVRVMDSWGKDNVLVVGENGETLGVITAAGTIKCLWEKVSEPLLTATDHREAGN